MSEGMASGTVPEPTKDLSRGGERRGDAGEASGGPMRSLDASPWRDAILESALDCIIIMDASGIVREFNPAAQRTFGYARDEAVGKALADLIVPPSLRERHRQGLRHYLATGEGPVLRKRIEIIGMHATGREFPVELAIIPFDQEGQRHFAGYLRDLTERTAAQEEIRRRTATIQLLQQIPMAANEAASVEEAARICLEKVCAYTGWPVGHAYFLDVESHRLISLGVWSLPPAATRYLDFRSVTESTPMPKGVGLPGRVWESRRPAWIPDVTKDANFPRARTAADIGVRGGFGFPVTVRDEVFAVLEFFSPEPAAPDDELLAVLGNVGDQLGRVIERRQAERELRAAYERLQELDKARIRLLNTAAHELGTPLTPILLQVGMLRDRLGSAVDEGKSLAILERNAERLKDLVKDLLDASRLETGNLRMELQAMDLAAEAARAVHAFEESAATNKLRLVMEKSAPVVVHADPRRTAQVLDNLLSNATKFTPAGGEVRVQAGSEDGIGWVEVRDSGIGIDAESATRLFQPFVQVHDPSQLRVAGTGLGLFISRGFVEACGGTLRCISPGRGKGTTFRVELPLEAA